MQRIIGSAPGKIILFGEHAVVYGQPAVAMAVNRYSFCIIQESAAASIQLYLQNYGQTLNLHPLDDLPPNVDSKFAPFLEGLQLFREKYKISFPNRLRIDICSNLISGAGLGSSASTACAFFAALAATFNIKIWQTDIDQLAFQLEFMAHGTPSGIDNTACAFGGVIQFAEGNRTPIKGLKDLELLLIYSGQVHNTKYSIEQVRNYRNANQARAEELFKKIGSISLTGADALRNADLPEIARLMEVNERCLEELGLATPEIQEIITLAHSLKIMGIKMTGAGAGGCLIALADRKKLLQFSKLLQSKGYFATLISPDNWGVLSQ